MPTKILNKIISTSGNTDLYGVFSVIPLDIEGSNIGDTGWMPSKKDVEYMGEENYKLAIEEYNLKNAKVLFKNVSLHWDSCDCGGDYGCSHGGFVYEITVLNNGKNITIHYLDREFLEFYNEDKYCQIPAKDATIFDFIRMCEICKIELEFTDYALSLLKKHNN